MTIDKSIEVLTRHKLHWEHLLEQGICDASEGIETIDALTMANASLEAWKTVRQEIEDILETLSDGGDDWFTAEKLNDVLEIIDKHLQGEVDNKAHWIPDEVTGYNCDNCGTWFTRASKFCPDCGRIMEIEDNV